MADEMEEQIEAAEEAANIPELLSIIGTCSVHTGEDDWDAPAEASLDAFYRLVKGGRMPPEDALMTIFASLKAWRKEEAIVEVALGCIVAICSKISIYVQQDAAADTTSTLDVNLVIEIMKSYKDESTIQEQACLAIEGLATSSDTLKKQLVAIEGIQQELTAARDLITNERNKKYPVQAASALGFELS
jgi:hypothetical protein